MTKAKTKSKTPAPQAPVPQDDREASEAVARIGACMREVGRVGAALNDEVAKLTQKAADVALPFQREQADLTEGLRIYCEANRERLTGGGKTKTIEFDGGKAAWRARPPKVTLRDVEQIIERIKRAGEAFAAFLRTKDEVNKEAMLAQPDLARTIAGVSVASAGEDFIVEPTEVELAEVKS
jgi:phage host-nuclease inhibitor protein Gam